MSRFNKLEGVIEIKDEQTEDGFTDKFIDFIEANGWFFGGGT
ncbi:hypothetical protein [Paenibacillus sp. KN14-4R]